MESSLTKNYADLVRQAEHAFISGRVTNEQIFQRWVDGLKKIPEADLLSMGIDINSLNVRELLSESYKDKLDDAAVNQQIDNVNAMIEKVNVYVDNLNKKAVELIRQMDNMENNA